MKKIEYSFYRLEVWKLGMNLVNYEDIQVLIQELYFKLISLDKFLTK